MHFALVNLPWPGALSRKTYKLHLRFPALELVLMRSLAQKHGHSAEVFDTCSQEDLPSSQQLAQADWIIVATTPYHMWQCPNSDWDWIKSQLGNFPREKTVLSGIHGTVFPEQTMAETGVHALLGAEPESSFAAFLKTGSWPRIGDSEPFGNASGMSESKPLPLDELQAHYLPGEECNYFYPLLGKNTLLFESSRGCPWKCTFCCQEMFQGKYRWKSPQVFAAEVATNIAGRQAVTAYFFDLEFTVSRKRTVEVCEALIARDVPRSLRWACQTRADTVDTDLLKLMKRAGCHLVHFGVESAHEPALQQTNKKITREQIDQGIASCKSAGLASAGFFIFGLPGEQPSDFEKTLQFARKVNPTFASFHFAIPFPGTALYQQYLDETHAENGIWPRYYFRDWSPQQIHDFLQRAYREFYLKPKLTDPGELLRRTQSSLRSLPLFLSVAYGGH